MSHTQAETKHTPTPWHKVVRPAPCRECAKQNVTETAIVGADEIEIMLTSPHNEYGLADVDIDFVISAVNNHESLLAALERINEFACYASEENTDARADMLLRIGITARAAIAKAEVKE
jgi:hypothetical protein